MPPDPRRRAYVGRPSRPRGGAPHPRTGAPRRTIRRRCDSPSRPIRRRFSGCRNPQSIDIGAQSEVDHGGDDSDRRSGRRTAARVDGRSRTGSTWQRGCSGSDATGPHRTAVASVALVRRDRGRHRRAVHAGSRRRPPLPPRPRPPRCRTRLPAGPDGLARPAGPDPTSTTPATADAGRLATTPLMAKIEKRRAEVALLGDRLLTLRDELDLARDQVATATASRRRRARPSARRAGGPARHPRRVQDRRRPAARRRRLRTCTGLEGLARIQRGEPAATRPPSASSPSRRSPAQRRTPRRRRLRAAHRAHRAARQAVHPAQQGAVRAHQARGRERLGASPRPRPPRRRATSRSAPATPARSHGKGADPRAVAAVRYAMAQLGDPYVWSDRGPGPFDCSGLMWAAYRTPEAGSYALPRVSRDQYYATRDRAVDRYSLLPGDLLFFSSSNSWTGIHHVAMYVGDGQDGRGPAQRPGRPAEVPVRWTRLFQATRVYAAVDGPARPAGPRPGPDAETHAEADEDPKPTIPTPTKTEAVPGPGRDHEAPDDDEAPTTHRSRRRPRRPDARRRRPRRPPSPATARPPTRRHTGARELRPAGAARRRPGNRKSATSTRPATSSPPASAKADRPDRRRRPVRRPPRVR